MAQDGSQNIVKLGKLLEEEYGEGKPQDLHVQYFYLILGSEILSKRQEIIMKLSEVASWGGLSSDWPCYIVGKFESAQTIISEREREEKLNKLIRIPLLRELGISLDSQNPSAIIISRVCKYTSAVVPKSKLATHEIESLLQNPYDQHLDHFYLTLYVKIVGYPAKVPEILSKLPGDWKSVTPKEMWPLTFIGYFPKKSFESEREREWRLNVQVRLPLKQYFYGQIKRDQGPQDTKMVVGVLFSRVCKYTNM